jgi:hypothetical protein
MPERRANEVLDRWRELEALHDAGYLTGMLQNPSAPVMRQRYEECVVVGHPRVDADRGHPRSIVDFDEHETTSLRQLAPSGSHVHRSLCC